MPEPRPDRVDDLTINESDTFTFDWKGPLKGNTIKAGSPALSSRPTGFVFGAPTINGTKVVVAASCPTPGEYRVYCKITVDETNQILEATPGVRLRVVRAGEY